MMYVILLLLLFLPDIYISRNYIHEPIIMFLYWLPTLFAIFAVIALWNGSSRKMIKNVAFDFLKNYYFVTWCS